MSGTVDFSFSTDAAGNVHLSFDHKIKLLVLPPESAQQVAALLLKHAGTTLRDFILEGAAREVEAAGGDSTEYHAARIRAMKIPA